MKETTYPDVGKIWQEADGWYWETIYGAHGGPGRDSDSAKHSMQCSWATANRKAAGLDVHSRGARYPLVENIGADQVASWQDARALICRRWT